MIYTHDIEVSTTEVREAWATIMSGRNPFSDRQSGSLLVTQSLDRYRRPTADQFIGATGAQIQDRLDHGYSVEGKDLDVSGGQTDFVMPMLELDDEEGELLIDQILGGEDLYRIRWTESEAPKSLTIRACIGMHAGTSADVLAEYMVWLLKVIDAAQRRGVSPDVELWIGLEGSFQRVKDSLRVRIPLVQSGEVMDVDAWRAYLTPGAFRSLGFVAVGLAADKTTRRLTAGMGAPTNARWAITLENGVLDIECPGGDKSFPEERMDELLTAAQAGA